MTDIAEYIRVVVKPLYETAGWTIVEANVADPTHLSGRRSTGL